MGFHGRLSNVINWSDYMRNKFIDNPKETTAYKLYKKVMNEGELHRIRDRDTKEIFDCKFIVNYPFHSFKHLRPNDNDNLDYIKREFQWYLSASLKDHRILKHAKMWKHLVQPNDYIFSNYGFYWFGKFKIPYAKEYEQHSLYEYIVNLLKKEPYTRRAYLPMCSHEHMFENNTDVLCTKGISFFYRDEFLHMKVSMRSSDLALGATIDWPCFNWLHEMVCHDTSLDKGLFLMDVDSLHIYEDYFDRVNKLLSNNDKEFNYISYPKIDDTQCLLNYDEAKNSISRKSEFFTWLTRVEL